MTRFPQAESQNPSNRRTEPSNQNPSNRRTAEPSEPSPRPLTGVIVIATVLVLLRSAVFVFYEQAHFDSDQAITGLMARDLVHLHAFPLFFYGQHYLLAIEAWLAAPFLLVLGTTVAALKLPVLLLNLAAVWLLVWLLVRDGGLSPGAALLASLFVALPPPATASRLVEAVGCNIEPFVFVLLLWLLRRRPWWFGIVLATGTLTREFVAYGATALLMLALAERRHRATEALRYLGLTVLGATVVLASVSALARVASNVSATKPGPTLAGVDPSALPAHAATLITRILPALLGARRDPLGHFNIASAQASGHDWLAPLLALTLAFVVFRIAGVVVSRSAGRDRPRGEPFSWYLLLVGVQAAAAFVLIPDTDDMQFRYVLLALLVPAALVALHLQVERLRPLRLVTVAVSLVWAGAALADHGMLLTEYWTHRPPRMARELALYLENNGIAYGEADYWTAYHVTYLTDTRVILTPRTLVRIPEYARLVDAHAATAARIGTEPCPGAAHIRRWYVCR